MNHTSSRVSSSVNVQQAEQQCQTRGLWCTQKKSSCSYSTTQRIAQQQVTQGSEHCLSRTPQRMGRETARMIKERHDCMQEGHVMVQQAVWSSMHGDAAKCDESKCLRAAQRRADAICT